MSLPPASDYQDAIQNPAFCFQDPELRGGAAATNRLGLPRVASGNFASVYEVQNGSAKWAVRCFLRQSADQQRYATLSSCLKSLAVPELVQFTYLHQGIRVRGSWLPVVKMDWVEGVTLQTYVGQCVNDPARLRILALQWRGLMERLRRSRVAHCDLQHGNVLVTPDEQLRLVDYDGMFVPSLRGRPSHELGHPNYQHPLRGPADYGESLDNFSALVIYTSLRALVGDPGLWTAFDTGENLLFSATDFKAPVQSPLFLRMRRSSDAGVRTLAERIGRSCTGTPAGAPDFKSLVESLPPIEEPKPWWAASGAGTDIRQKPRAGRPTGENAGGAANSLSGAEVAAAPWWMKRPSTLISEFRLPPWIRPAYIHSQVVERVRALPVKETIHHGVRCLCALCAGCAVAIMLTVGFHMALQIGFQQLASWLDWPPKTRAVSPRTVQAVDGRPPPAVPTGPAAAAPGPNKPWRPTDRQ